jgi:hypothetical protein
MVSLRSDIYEILPSCDHKLQKYGILIVYVFLKFSFILIHYSAYTSGPT